MRHLKRSILLLAIVLQSGCAYIYSLNENLPQQIDKWMQNEEYSKVLDTLAYLDPQHPHYDRLSPLRSVAEQKSLAYEARILNTGKQLLDKQQWYEAGLNYQEGLSKLPDSAAIQQAYADFIDQRKAYLDNLNRQLLFHRSEWLLANSPVKGEIARVVPEHYKSQQQWRFHQQEQQQTLTELLDCAEDRLNVHDLNASEKCLDFALRLSTGPPPVRYEKLHKRLSDQKKLLNQILSKTAQVHLVAAEDAMKKNQLQVALNEYRKIPTQEQHKPRVLQFKKQLDENIKAAVKQGAALGRKLYSDGKIHEALQTWKASLALDPDNDALKQHIDRAHRVINKLKSLSEQREQTGQ